MFAGVGFGFGICVGVRFVCWLLLLCCLWLLFSDLCCFVGDWLVLVDCFLVVVFCVVCWCLFMVYGWCGVGCGLAVVFVDWRLLWVIRSGLGS